MDVGDLPSLEDPPGSKNLKDQLFRAKFNEFILAFLDFLKNLEYYKYYCRFKIPPLSIFIEISGNFTLITIKCFRTIINFLFSNPIINQYRNLFLFIFHSFFSNKFIAKLSLLFSRSNNFIYLWILFKINKESVPM